MKSETITQAIQIIKEELESSKDKVSIQFQLNDIENLTGNERIRKEVKIAYEATEKCDDELDADAIEVVEFCIEEIEDELGVAK